MKHRSVGISPILYLIKETVAISITACILIAGCSDEVTPPEKKNFSFKVTVEDTLGLPVEGMHIGRKNYLRGCINEPSLVNQSSGKTAKQFIYNMAANYPNPFSFATTIKFGLAESCSVNLDIFDWEGTKVAEIVNEVKRGGYYTVAWDGTDETGAPVRDGIYTYRILALDIDTDSRLFFKERLLTVYNSLYPHPIYSEIGRTNSAGVYQSTDPSIFPYVQGFGLQTCYNEVGSEAGTCSFIDSATIIISFKAAETDTTETYYRIFHDVELSREANDFRFTWGTPQDTITFIYN